VSFSIAADRKCASRLLLVFFWSCFDFAQHQFQQRDLDFDFASRSGDFTLGESLQALNSQSNPLVADAYMLVTTYIIASAPAFAFAVSSVFLHSIGDVFKSSDASSLVSDWLKVVDVAMENSLTDFVSKAEVVGLTGQTLLRALCNDGLIDPDSHCLEEIDACLAECEVHIAQEWLEKMPEPSYEERYMLTLNRVPNKHARLGCQVVLSPKHQNKICNVDIRLNSDSNIVTTLQSMNS
jgi:hypothetical protein